MNELIATISELIHEKCELIMEDDAAGIWNDDRCDWVVIVE